MVLHNATAQLHARRRHWHGQGSGGDGDGGMGAGSDAARDPSAVWAYAMAQPCMLALSGTSLPTGCWSGKATGGGAQAWIWRRTTTHLRIRRGASVDNEEQLNPPVMLWIGSMGHSRVSVSFFNFHFSINEGSHKTSSINSWLT